MTTNQPKALELADFLDHLQGCAEAADELRRLHQSEKEGWRHADELEQDRKRLHEVNAELVEIVKAVAHIDVDFGYGEYCLEPHHIEAARAAIAKATGEQHAN
jgi:multidrug resistance efflux pump